MKEVHRQINGKIIWLGVLSAVLVGVYGLSYAQSQQPISQLPISQLDSAQPPAQEIQEPAQPDLDVTSHSQSAASLSGVDEIALQQTQKPAWQRRHEATGRLNAMQEGKSPEEAPLYEPYAMPQGSAGAAKVSLILPSGMNPAVDLNLPHYANSPNIRKFVDSLPGLAIDPAPGDPNVNGLGQYIPVAIADAASYPGSDYYEIAVVEYATKMNTDLPPTELRGYVQIETPANAASSKHVPLTYPKGGAIMAGSPPAQVYAVDYPQYLGPLILCQKDRPVRVKFSNYLPVGVDGDLFLPVDTMVMGAGMGPIGMQMYTQNRATLHLHGGRTPWISDGTPHQWTAPANETTSYMRGVSAQNVPDMPDPGPGTITFYWTNAQSARLLFYHDHSWGITRLNVYAGEAAGYLITDAVEENLINTNVLPDQAGLGALYRYGVPLVIQDKTFVNDATTAALRDPAFDAGGGVPTPFTSAVDPLWYSYVGMTGSGWLWLPHEYVVNENIYDPSGITMMGRWDYGPWMNPPMMVNHYVLPSPTITPESFLDTPTVNGTAYPYVTVPPAPVRFRILNACNDRMLNLQLYYAEPLHVSVTHGGSGYSATPTVTLTGGGGTYTSATATVINGVITGITVVGAASYTSAPIVTISDISGLNATAIASPNTEVKMVEACPDPLFPTWPKDGRDGGVPDPTTQGPPIYLIGNEAGFLANVAVVPPQPVDYDYNRKNATFGGVTSKSLYLPPAVRADMVVDFSLVPPGSTLILYNDAPAPMPLYDTRYDYFTDDPDQTLVGGAPMTPAGYGPNTRTIMQIRVQGAPAPIPNLLANLQTALPQAFAAAQDPPVVPQSAFNAAYNANWPDTFANVTTESLNVTGTGQPIARILAVLPGIGYTTPPTVNIVSANGGGASASAGLNPIGGITLVTGGSGYTSPPLVTLGPPVLPLTPLPLAPGGVIQGIQATAVATISGGQVTAISIVEPGAGYTNIVTPPTITIAAPTGAGGVTATASVMLPTLNTVGSIVITNAGAGYIDQPQVYLTGGGGMGAQAVAMLNGAMVPTYKNIVEGFDPDYGRMFVQLGSTPNPLTPNIGAGLVMGMAHYIDPPTELLSPEQPILWRITHLGVDSHALHFHLFDVQVINRVDWANIIKPPEPEEVGWKDTIRTNPFEDILLALKPKAAVMKLPFGLPDSIRLLDPSTPAGSTANFQPIAPLPGVPVVAQVSNVMTNFGWEYVFHCHLLGHEENDMMRPVVFQVPSTLPATPTLTATSFATSNITSAVQLNWVDGTPFNYVTGLPLSTLGNPANEIGFRVEKSLGGNGNLLPLQNALANATSLVDTNVAIGSTYRYRVTAYNAAGNRASSSVTVTVAAPAVPSAPTNLVATVPIAPAVNLTWRDNANNETGFAIERSDNGGAFVQIAMAPPRAGTGSTSYTDNTVVAGPTTYQYRVKAVNGVLSSGYATSNTVTVPLPPAAPSNLTATATAGNGNNRDTVTLNWTDNSNNETNFQIQRATDAGFTANVNNSTVGANTVTTTQNRLPRGVTYWYHVRAYNNGGYSDWCTAVSITTP